VIVPSYRGTLGLRSALLLLAVSTLVSAAVIAVLGGFVMDDFRKRFAGSQAIHDLDRGVLAVVGGTQIFVMAGSSPPHASRGR
jgi:hypothetical protein